MMWTVTSDRIGWPRGERLSAAALSGCNIDALVQGGHLAAVPDEPKTKKRMPVDPVPDETADEPEEQ
jgi:hypothetical protein